MTVGNIQNITGNTQVTVDAQLGVSGDLCVSAIRGYNASNQVVIAEPCVVGTTASNQPLTVNGTLTAKALAVTNTLTLNGVSVQTKPYVAVRVASSAILSGNNNGQIATANMSLQAGRTSGQVYTFTFSPAHPNGVNYMVMATPNTATTFYVCTTQVVSSTSFSVWCRSAANAIIDGDFFVCTVP